MEAFIALLIFGLVAAGITAANRQSQRINRSWADAAGRLGLEFQPGSPFRRRAIRGSHGSIRVELAEKSGGNNNTVRQWRMSYPSTPFSMTLTVETPGMKLLKAFGAEDFEVGDPTFDARFMVAGSDHAAIARFLDRDRRAALLEAAERMQGIKVTNSDISWRTTGQYKTADALLDDAKVLLRTAAAITGSGQSPVAPIQPRRPVVAVEPERQPVNRLQAVVGDDPWVASHELPAVPTVELSDRPPDDAAEPEAPSGGDVVRLDDLIEEVLGTRHLSFEANQIVAERYAGRSLVVLGPVRRARKVDRDFDFRDHGPGVRIELVVGELTGTRVGAGDVIAVVHVPGPAPVPERGTEVLVSGTIMKVETLRRTIFLEDAQLG